MVAVKLLAVPVTVTVYVPAVVPGLLVPPPPPHADIPLAIVTRNISIPSIMRQPRRRVGVTKKHMKANAIPPAGLKNCLNSGTCAVLLAVVFTVRFAVAVVVPVMFTDEGMLQVGKSVGLLRLVVTEQDRLTIPVNPPAGVTVIVEEFPVVMPGLSERFPLLLRLNPRTAIVTAVEAVIFPVATSVPVTADI